MSDDGFDSETISDSEAPTTPGSPPSAPFSPPITVSRASLLIGGKFGPYRLLKLLGKGGMGEVYEAEQEETGRRVALKVLSRALPDLAERSRFLREGRLAGSVSHPNSVYVYGTQEVEGTAVIAMELVSGGTLKDRVEGHGPLPTREAVDATLQIMEGLEAAAARGVLHRDIKPSNCFLAEDGTVKVGDYGLSMSVFSHAESHLTETGTFLGTPAFASPEQVRGDTVDVRSDIYSVGATLFYLVTGQASFEGKGVGQLLAAVLERAPERPRNLRPEVPRGLERAILRCLEKQPASRFSDYASLRSALQPFGSAALAPATLSLRLAAGTIDHFIIFPPYLAFRAYQAATGGTSPRDLFIQHPGLSTLSVGGFLLVYYTFLEGRWGASIGKRITGLRVVGPDGGVPGVPRALLRTTVWLTFYLLAPFAAVAGTALARAQARDLISLLLWVLSLALAFATARRRNGFAGLHDLASETRVTGGSLLRRKLIRLEEPSIAPSEIRRRIGPYAVIKTLSERAGESLLLGYDEPLRRHVWIRTLPPGAPPVPALRRDLGRAGRLRWLNGQRNPGEAWDAYESVPGRGLRGAVDRHPTWETVQLWLLDIAEELEAGEKDSTLPSELSLEGVWITSDDRAKLLDFPAPSDSAALSPRVETPTGLLQLICHRVARGPVPLHARSFVDALSRGDDATPASVALRLRAFLGRPASVSPLRRISHVALCGFLVLCVSGGALAGAASSARGPRPFDLLVGIAGIGTAIAGAALLSAFFFRGGFLLGLLGMAVVRRDGIPASRIQSLWRSLVGWSPYWILAVAAFGASYTSVNPSTLTALAVLGATPIVILVFWDAWSHPERGFQDRIAGTFLVPR